MPVGENPCKRHLWTLAGVVPEVLTVRQGRDEFSPFFIFVINNSSYMETVFVKTLSKKECYEQGIPTTSDPILQKVSACYRGYFLTPLRNPHRLESGFAEDFKTLPEYVLIDGVEFKKNSDRAVRITVPYQIFCAEYYRVDYEGKIKNGSGHWEEDGVIRPSVPEILPREMFQPTRMRTMKYWYERNPNERVRLPGRMDS